MYNRGEHFNVEILTQQEIDAFFAAFPSTWVGLRNRAFFAVCLWGQLRCMESANLRLTDIDFERSCITVHRGKGGYRRVVAFPRKRLEILKAWLRQRPAESQWLFCTSSGNQLDGGYLRKIIKKIARYAGIVKRVHPHQLRHSGAFQLANMGTDPRMIQRQLGHRNLATTDRYINHLGAGEVIQTLADLTW